MNNGTDTTLTRGWAISTLVIELVISVFGVIGSGLSLYCLLTCKKVQERMKIHLCLLFSTSILTCVLSLPGNAVVEQGTLLGWDIDVNTTRGFVAFYTILASLDRNVNAVLAVYRMVAVVFPFRYNTISRNSVSLVVDVSIYVSMAILWITVFVAEGNDVACVTNPTCSRLGYIVSCLQLTPIIITVIAYISMILSMAAKKRNLAEFVTPTHGEKDQPTMAVTILILVNIALDVPHTIIHLMLIDSAEISYVVIHVFYRLHFALDPFVFIGLNRRYRQTVIRKCLPLVQVKSVSDSPQACGEGTPGTTHILAETRCHLPAGTV